MRVGRVRYLLVFLSLWAAFPGLAQADERSALERRGARARAVLDADTKARRQWQREYRRLLASRAGALARSESAQREARSWRKRQRLRGAKRVDAESRIAGAREELARIELALDAFRQRAVGGGAQPGWLAEVEDDFRPDADLPPGG